MGWERKTLKCFLSRQNKAPLTVLTGHMVIFQLNNNLKILDILSIYSYNIENSLHDRTFRCYQGYLVYWFLRNQIRIWGRSIDPHASQRAGRLWISRQGSEQRNGIGTLAPGAVPQHAAETRSDPCRRQRPFGSVRNCPLFITWIRSRRGNLILPPTKHTSL